MEPSVTFGHRPAASHEPALTPHPIETSSPQTFDAAGMDQGDSQLTPTVIICAGYGLGVIALMLCFFISLWPNPSRPVWPIYLAAGSLLATTPLGLSLLLRAPDGFSQKYLRPALIFAITLPTAGLFVDDGLHSLVDPWPPVTSAGVFALAVTGLVWSAARALDGRALRSLLLAAFVAGGAYGYVAPAFADIQFDGGRASVLPTPVLNKYISRGRRSTSYYLDLPAWGPRARPNAVQVSSATYDKLQVGDTVCIALHPGALAMPWFTAKPCWS